MLLKIFSERFLLKDSILNDSSCLKNIFLNVSDSSWPQQVVYERVLPKDSILKDSI
jgi:hypothetical protein